ncbi:hypothetical protein Vretifemale_8198, partial [Volvox reticuliferus]
RRRIRVDRLPAVVNPWAVADAAAAAATAPAATAKDNVMPEQRLKKSWSSAGLPEVEDAAEVNVFKVEAEADTRVAAPVPPPPPLVAPAFHHMPSPPLLLPPPPPPPTSPPPVPVQDMALLPPPYSLPQLGDAMMAPSPYVKWNRRNFGGAGGRGDVRGVPKPPLPPQTPRQMQM